MPELPEVETTLLGIKPHLEGQSIREVIVREPRLRIPVPSTLQSQLHGKTIHRLSRRAKYIIAELSEGYLLIHLGMSGHLRVVQNSTPPGRHDHIDCLLKNGTTLRYCDPRRFGLLFYIPQEVYQHKLLNHLGPEPLFEEFHAAYLYQKSRNRNTPIKSFIMNNSIVVGVGNIYATESLFLAKLHPLLPAKKLTLEQCAALIVAIKYILNEAIKAGGTTLKDFYGTDGKPGYFNFSLKIYGRTNQLCYLCNQTIESVSIGGRRSAYCPNCQAIL